MKLQITYKEMEGTEAISATIERQASKLQEYITEGDQVKVIVGAKNHHHFAEVLWHDKKMGKDIFAKEDGDNLYQQIEAVFENVIKQVRKEHEKLQDKHHKKKSPKRG